MHATSSSMNYCSHYEFKGYANKCIFFSHMNNEFH